MVGVKITRVDDPVSLSVTVAHRRWSPDTPCASHGFLMTHLSHISCYRHYVYTFLIWNN